MSKKIQTPIDNNVMGVILVNPTTGLPYSGVSSTQEKIVYKLFDARTTTGTSTRVKLPSGRRWIHAYVIGTGAVSVTVTWYGAQDVADPGVALNVPVVISGTTTAVDGVDLPGEMPYIYAIISAISGTGAAATVTVSI